MNPLYQKLLEVVSSFPVVDCHEHMMGPAFFKPHKEPIAFFMQGYFPHDLTSASFGTPQRELDRLADDEVSTEEKWPLFERLWKATEHTAYARVTKIVMKRFFGVSEMSFQSLGQIADQLADRKVESYLDVLDGGGIKAVITDVLGWLPDGPESFLSGKVTFPENWFPVIALPGFHPTSFSYETVKEIAALVDTSISSLQDFLEVTFRVFKRCKALGCVAFKDQSAYNRTLDYEVTAFGEAEKQFNMVLNDPRSSLGWPESKALNDFLFHHYMRFAGDLDLPVQIHTGHMAGNYNRVDKTNAALFTPVLELHKDVRFDLFHGNWPYMGDALFLGKNYPNVSLDLCWLHMIDPLYARQMMERAVMTIPHTKLHGFGGDYADAPEFAVAHLELTYENTAFALANLVEMNWIDELQALQLAADWLYNNPNRFFRLGLEEFTLI